MTTQAIGPGEILADELQAREWSQAQFAEIIGRPVQLVCEIVTGKKEITQQTAAQIGAALGTSAEVWLDLQHKHRLERLRQDAKMQQRLDLICLRKHLAQTAREGR